MKSTGIVRGIDNLGRIVLPKELRTSMKLETDSKLEIFVEGDQIILKKYRAAGSCDFCGEVDPNAVQFAGYCICSECRKRSEPCNKRRDSMSQMIDLTLPSTVPGRTLHAFRCVPEGEVRAILQLSHGMVEFIDRYKPLAESLAQRGILVTGNDHLGHGGSIRTKADYGYFAEPDGNRAVLEDLHSVTKLTKQLYPGVPYFLLGHSMGSFYARQYLCEWGEELDGAIIMGTGFQPKALVTFARAVCRVLAVFFGWQHRSKLVAKLSFLGYNKGLEGRTTHDWLNRDHAEVDKYLADERCTFTFTLNAYYSMFSGILRLYDPAFLDRMPKDLPVLFLAGDADPVGERSAGVKRAVESMKNAGMRNVRVKFYPGARHELLVETNKLEVFADIGDFVEQQL